MVICEYGCGQEAQYQLKNGKWCCCEFWQRCPNKRKETSIISKLTHNTESYKNKIRENTLKQFENESSEDRQKRIEKIKTTCNSPSYKEKRKQISIDLWNDGEYRSMMMPRMKKSFEHRQKLSESAFHRFENEMEEEKHLRIQKAKDGAKKYFQNESETKRKHRINSKKRTIEKIKRKYPIFYKEEEMRYNPDKPGEKEIQIHCKNHNCPNSKEQGGWFTPTNRQIEAKIAGLDDNLSYFYCSEKCKDECELFNLHSDPNRLDEYNKYKDQVFKVTYKSLQEYGNRIKNLNLRGRDNEYDLDHMFSIYNGFEQNVDPEIVGHWKNLKIVKDSKNRSKGKKSNISLKELMNKIKEV